MYRCSIETLVEEEHQVMLVGPCLLWDFCELGTEIIDISLSCFGALLGIIQVLTPNLAHVH